MNRFRVTMLRYITTSLGIKLYHGFIYVNATYTWLSIKLSQKWALNVSSGQKSLRQSKYYKSLGEVVDILLKIL